MISDALAYLTDPDSWWGRSGLVRLTWNHVQLSAVALLAAVLIAVPPALLLGHRHRGGALAISLVNLSRALPTFAVIAFVLPLSYQLDLGFGFWPTFVALLLLALPPVFVNAFTGVDGVDPAVVEAARGMGMRDAEVLRRVELPAALPLLAAGVRVSAVQVVATTTLGTLVGFRSLGEPIIVGIASRDYGKVLAGAVVVAVLSLLTDAAFGALGRRLAPWSRERSTESRVSVQHAS
ncbi:MAG: ABC transporter permease [Acidimicrobiia bacterium]